jgi:predicted N-formylglutamate amidohydrolase
MTQHQGREGSDPPPVTIVNSAGASPFVLVCEHASNFIPARYQRLGLPDAELLRHIAWDVGAADLTRALATRLDAPAFLAGVSRLLIDCNRPLDSFTSIPTVSEKSVPGNQNLEETERTARIRTWFEPFHSSISAYLDMREARGAPTAIVGVHSFTPVFAGVERPMHAGILFAASSAFGRAMIADLARDERLIIAENAPYRIDDEDWTIPTHADDRGLPGVLIEIRHDQLSEPGLIEAWADKLTNALLSAWRTSRRRS